LRALRPALRRVWLCAVAPLRYRAVLQIELMAGCSAIVSRALCCRQRCATLPKIAAISGSAALNCLYMIVPDGCDQNMEPLQ
jgi:hypothetical protein